MFAPEDLTIVKGSPQIRRRFMDMELGQIQPTYVYHLGQYQRILKQRNTVLKQLQRNLKQDKGLLEVLTDQLISHEADLLVRRFVFLNLLSMLSCSFHSLIISTLVCLDIHSTYSV